MFMSHGHGNLSHPCVGKKLFALFAHGCIARSCHYPWCRLSIRHALVPGRVVLESLCSMFWWCEEFALLIAANNFINIRFKTSTVYLKSAEFGMHYLNCTIWENTEYRERNFSIWLRSRNARICCI
ncbi:hypothetical protein GOBAR_AA00376 [Gossypium barbadense]|uniref:Uncharacterized protein n=1 Tax=Gossypium barbadense TaxID=3634 RepID=A0A2P5YX58_GOSBA|nr:hypothetical protein GOBAR_AA00376 [Gossypium barbadense]